MFYSAVACQGYQIYFLNIQKVTVVREISSMNKKSYFNSNNSIFLRFSNSFNIQWFRVVQKISLMKKIVLVVLFDIAFDVLQGLLLELIPEHYTMFSLISWLEISPYITFWKLWNQKINCKGNVSNDLCF